MIYSPLEQFEIVSIVPLVIGNYDLSLTNSSLYLWLVFGAIVFILKGTLEKVYYIPSVWQTLIEDIYNFIISLIDQNCGEEGQKYFPFYFVLFNFILVCNLVGMIPYSFTVTSHFVVIFTLSLSIWLGVTLIGLQRHGAHFFHLFVPAGAPAALLPFLVVIELISYIIRAISLAVRLFANMMSGHTLLKIMAGFSLQIFAFGGLLGIIGSAIPLLLVFVVTGFEIGVALLQAYVFTILSIMYLNDAIHLH